MNYFFYNFFYNFNSIFTSIIFFKKFTSLKNTTKNTNFVTLSKINSSCFFLKIQIQYNIQKNFENTIGEPAKRAKLKSGVLFQNGSNFLKKSFLGGQHAPARRGSPTPGRVGGGSTPLRSLAFVPTIVLGRPSNITQ